MTSDDSRRLNFDIGRAEQDHDVTSLERILHKSLVFRRASGRMVGKQQYLDALLSTAYTVLESTDVEEMHERNGVAVWTVNVRAKGTTAEGAEFGGVFHNVRNVRASGCTLAASGLGEHEDRRAREVMVA